MNLLAEIHFNTMLDLAEIVGQNTVLVELSTNEADGTRRTALLLEAAEKLEEYKRSFRSSL